MAGTKLRDAHVIIVDDDPDLRTIWALILLHEKVSHQVLSPTDAFNIPTSDWKRATLVVTDWLMGDISGKEVIEHALQHNPTVRCHVLTALVDVRDVPVGVQMWLKPTMISTIIQEARHSEQ